MDGRDTKRTVNGFDAKLNTSSFLPSFIGGHAEVSETVNLSVLNAVSQSEKRERASVFLLLAFPVVADVLADGEQVDGHEE